MFHGKEILTELKILTDQIAKLSAKLDREKPEGGHALIIQTQGI